MATLKIKTYLMSISNGWTWTGHLESFKYCPNMEFVDHTLSVLILNGTVCFTHTHGPQYKVAENNSENAQNTPLITINRDKMKRKMVL